MDFEQLMETEVQRAFDMEQQLTQALGTMAQYAQSADLREAFDDHRRETAHHAERVEEAARALGIECRGQQNELIRFLIESGDRKMQGSIPSAVADAMLIAAAQKAEHIEIATYGTLKALAKEAGNKDAERLFEENLDEEGDADKRLSKIAESKVNEKAFSETAKARLI